MATIHQQAGFGGSGSGADADSLDGHSAEDFVFVADHDPDSILTTDENGDVQDSTTLTGVSVSIQTNTAAALAAQTGPAGAFAKESDTGLIRNMDGSTAFSSLVPLNPWVADSNVGVKDRRINKTTLAATATTTINLGDGTGIVFCGQVHLFFLHSEEAKEGNVFGSLIVPFANTVLEGEDAAIEGDDTIRPTLSLAFVGNDLVLTITGHATNALKVWGRIVCERTAFP